MILEDLYSIIQYRINTLPKGSYTASLYKKGEDAILQKIGEEATELIIAAKGKRKKRIIEEVADLYFITLVFLVAKGISLDALFEELKRRQK